MNKLEKQMKEILLRGKENYGVIGVKAEFEAEGTRMEELLRLVDVTRAADLSLTLKIGGCEAIRDLLDVRQIGVSKVVAPMVETPYALKKYIAAKNLVYDEHEQSETDFLFNLETKTAFQNLEEMLRLSKTELSGVVFGRVDYSESLGLGREAIHSDEITETVSHVAVKVKDAKLDMVVGGAISMDSLTVLRQINEIHLSRFETRKVVFDGDSCELPEIPKGLLNAVHFELLWLKNKSEYYGRIHREDDKRIKMLEARWVG